MSEDVARKERAEAARKAALEFHENVFARRFEAIKMKQSTRPGYHIDRQIDLLFTNEEGLRRECRGPVSLKEYKQAVEKDLLELEYETGIAAYPDEGADERSDGGGASDSERPPHDARKQSHFPSARRALEWLSTKTHKKNEWRELSDSEHEFYFNSKFAAIEDSLRTQPDAAYSRKFEALKAFELELREKSDSKRSYSAYSDDVKERLRELMKERGLDRLRIIPELGGGGEVLAAKRSANDAHERGSRFVAATRAQFARVNTLNSN